MAEGAARGGRPRILSISFSPLRGDARVLRQVEVLREVGEVSTVGYGPAPDGVAAHLRVADHLASLPRDPRGLLLLGARRHRAAELAAPALRAAHAALTADPGPGWDLVVANDARALPLAHAVAGGAPVWADMHEWAPEEFSGDWRWRLAVKPFAEHLCARHLPRSAVVTTVCEPIAQLYRQRYGVECAVVRNAPAPAQLQPSPVDGERVRLVHSGSAIPGRGLEVLVDVVAGLDERFSLDLYLTPGGDGGRHLAQLEAAAAASGRTTVHDPVPPAEIVPTLNRYDVGVFSLPPTSVNARYALPNKFFDFVQARLALAVGPSPEMAREVRARGLGVVADDFSAAALRRALEGLDAAAVSAGKAASHRAARELSSATDRQVVLRLVERALAARRG
ncbi:glycosyltransferase family 4 protein [Kineococcus indalonis]|uniref:glycosyltransferase family 4 protein n=1 Tax=Kineococcus indalonis TaxID=2696566 RepID=UPI001412B402|nr:hypothetical protein [Kineococcus indalonis]